ncbi:MAG: redoxin domain-containing protein [Anaerolineales bacterium]|nr:redoxin domain-containing protein [Anaerolineales bacterium]
MLALFEGMQTQVLGLSVDSVPCLKAWADSLGGISYPLLSDFYPHGKVAKKYGVLRRDGTTERALFVLDRQGLLRYVDVHDIDQQPDNQVLFRTLAGIDPLAQQAYAAYQATLQPAPEPQAEVVMYCTAWCPACRRARQVLEQYKVNYVEVDITRDPEAAARVRGWANGNETTPVFNIRGQVIVGYDLVKLAKALGIEL